MCASHNFLETHNSSLVRIGFNNRPQSIALSVSTSKASIQQQKSKPKQKKVILIDGILIRGS